MPVTPTGDRLHVRLLGGFSCVYGDVPLDRLHADRPASLLAYLLLHRDAPVPRHYLAFRLWPDSTETQARTNLRNLLHALRQHLPDPDRFLAADTLTVQWRTDAPYTLDVADFNQALAEAEQARDASQRRHWLGEAVALYQGDLFPSSADDWILPLREELRQRYLDTLDRLSGLLEQGGEYREAMRVNRLRLQHDPLDESAHVQLMRLYALAGDRAGVRRAYEACVALLRRELDMEPSPTTQAAYAQLLRQEPVAAAPMPDPDAMPASTPALHPRPLPKPVTAFVGRAEELAEVSRLLAQPECHLLTILGPGGIGKTRLALEIAHAQQPQFAGNVAYASLTALESPAFLPAALADALGFTFSGNTALASEITQFLRDRTLLLVLDTFDHLLEGADLVAAIVAEAPGVKLLVTSRQRLHLVEEWTYELQGLPIPENGNANGDSAIALFAQSALRVDHAFALTSANRQDVATICRLVGGMPLAIELAASWVRVLSCAEIAAEIERSPDFLTAAMRNVPARHRSLRAVFDQSWLLLDADERRVLMRLSAFRGGFTREAAEWAAGATLPLLLSLVDKSLVRRNSRGRFFIHELIRQYAAGLLAEDAQEELTAHKQHADYFSRWIQRIEARLKSAEQQAAMVEINADIDNVRAGWRWLVQRRRLDHLVRMIPGLTWYYEIRGYYTEAVAAIEHTLAELHADAAADTLTDPADRSAYAMLVDHLGWFSARLGQTERAFSLLAESLSLAAPTGDDLTLYYLHSHWGWIALYTGDLDAAQQHIDLAQTHADKLALPWHRAIPLNLRAVIRLLSGEPAAALLLLTQSVTLWQACGDPRGLAYCLSYLSAAAGALGRSEEAIAYLHEGLELARRTSDPWSQANTLHLLGEAACAQQRHSEAIDHFRQSYDLCHAVGDRLGMARALVNLAHATAAGDPAGAQRLYHEALELAVAVDAVSHQLDALVGLAAVRSTLGDYAGSQACLTQVLVHPAVSVDLRRRAEAIAQEIADRLPAQGEGATR